ncbi:MAG: hypothetical protein PVF95_10570 [bacterium]|jgi:hypothetical protein
MTPSIGLLALVILALALAGCGRDKVVEESKTRWMNLAHEPVEEADAGAEVTVEVTVKVSPDIANPGIFLYYKSEQELFVVVPMQRFEEGRYFGKIPAHERGSLIKYYLEGRAGEDLVVQVPAEGRPRFEFYFKGTPNRYLLIAHIVIISIALFFFVLAGYFGYRGLSDRRANLHAPRLGLVGAVLFFISGIAIGMIVSFQTYGRPWTGFPLGTDLTDTKSLAIVLYWIAATFLYRGSALRKDPSTDMLPGRTIPYVYIAGLVLTVVLFLLPH